MVLTIRLLFLYAAVAGGVLCAARWLRRPFDLLTVGMVILVPLLFVLPGILQNKTPLPTDHIRFYCPPWQEIGAATPHNATLSDFASQFAPWAKAVRVALKEHSLPWRDRWNGCGTPLAANGVSAAFSPFTLLMLGLPLGRAYSLLGAVKLFIALTGTYLWLTELGVSREPARFGALTFALSFSITPWLYHPASAGLAVWPWILFALEYRTAENTGRRFWLLTILVAIWLLCGHLESVAIALVFCAFWMLLRTVARDFPDTRRRITDTCLAVLLGVGITAFSLVPQALAITASNRLALARNPDHFSYVPWVPYRPGWLGAFATTLYPRTFGDTVDSPMIPGSAGSIVEMGFGYIGLVGWICASLALTSRLRGTKERIFLATLLCGLGGAMGLGIFRAAVDLIPGLSLAPPLRLLTVVAISGTGLAAVALQRLINDGTDSGRLLPRLVGAALALALIAGAIFWHERGAYAAAGALTPQLEAMYFELGVCAAVLVVLWGYHIALIPNAKTLVTVLTLLAAGELFAQGTRLYRFYPVDTIYPDTPLLSFLRRQHGPFRVVGDGLALFPNTNVFAGLEDVRTHDPIERSEYVDLLDMTCGYPKFEYIKQIRDLNAPVLDFLNVRFLITSRGKPSPGPKWTLVYDGHDGNVFENTMVLPRVFAPQGVQVVAAGSADDHPKPLAVSTFGSLLAQHFATAEFRRRVLVAADPAQNLRPGQLDQADRTISLGKIVESTNVIHFETDVPLGSGPLVLVASIVQDGGWSARDEKARPVGLLFADGPFVGISVPMGHHEIWLTYRPPGLRIGILISIIALVGTFALGAIRRQRAVHRQFRAP